MRRFLDRVEYWHNKASDTQFVWFPFQFLKPAPPFPILFWRRLVMAVLFGIYCGFFLALRRWIFSHVDFAASLVDDVIYSICFFLIWFNLITAPLWNRRARRLQAKTSIKSSRQAQS
jgi:hypothetical protein